MTDKERQTFERLEQVYRRALDELEQMPIAFVLDPGPDLSFTPTPERERL